jgi:ribonuclease P protein component
VALVVPKHRRSAVARNRLKRRLREIARAEMLPRLDARGATVDILIRAHASAYEATFADLRQELVHWVDRQGPDAP